MACSEIHRLLPGEAVQELSSFICLWSCDPYMLVFSCLFFVCLSVQGTYEHMS